MFLNYTFQHQAFDGNWVSSHWKDTFAITLLLIYSSFQNAPWHLNFYFTTFHWLLFFLCLWLSMCCSFSGAIILTTAHCCFCLMLLGNIINVFPNGFLACRVWPLGRMKTRSTANKLLLREKVPKHTGLEN